MIVLQLDQLFLKRVHRFDEFRIMMARVGFNVFDMVADHGLGTGRLHARSL